MAIPVGLYYAATVAIPVVVDLLLRLAVDMIFEKFELSRNPCCSGPTPSTRRMPEMRGGIWLSQSLL